jgi:hypothetical protein
LFTTEENLLFSEFFNTKLPIPLSVKETFVGKGILVLLRGKDRRNGIHWNTDKFIYFTKPFQLY